MEIKYSLSKDISVNIKDNKEIIIHHNNNKHYLPYYSLYFLSFFNLDKNIVEVGQYIEKIVLNKEQIIEYFSTFNLLIDKGIISNGLEKEKIKRASIDPLNWGQQEIHKKMLHDEVRTSSFEKAIRDTVTDKIVIDIGCGTGILSLLAIRHGAKHVYAIDSSSKCIAYAKSLAKENNVENDITFINESCFDVEIEEKADVLISEVIGNSPLGEDIINIFVDAKKRLLKPKHYIIPNNLSIYALPVSLDLNAFDKKYFTKQDTIKWRENYQFDFSSLIKPSINTNEVLFLKPELISKVKILGKGTLLEHYNFNSASINVSDLKTDVGFQVDKNGFFNAILIYFESDLNEKNRLSIDPSLEDLKNSWTYVAYPLNNKSLDVIEGQKIKFDVESLEKDRSRYYFSRINQ